MNKPKPNPELNKTQSRLIINPDIIDESSSGIDLNKTQTRINLRETKSRLHLLEQESEEDRHTRYEFQRYVMDYLQDAIRLADLKVSLILGIFGFASPAFIKKWSHLITEIRNVGWSSSYVTLIVVTTFFYFTSLSYAIAVFKPRLPSTLNKGFIFFLDILGHESVGVYMKRAKRASAEDLYESVIRQNWSLSQIVTKKFRYTAHAINSGCVFLMLLIFCFLIIPSPG